MEFTRPQPGVADGPVEESSCQSLVLWCSWTACWTHRVGSAQTGPPACHMTLTRWLSAVRGEITRFMLMGQFIFSTLTGAHIKMEQGNGYSCTVLQLTSMELYRCLEKLYSMSRAVKLSTANSRALSCPFSGRSHTSSHVMLSTVWPASHRMPSKRSSRSTQWYSSHCGRQVNLHTDPEN